MTTYSVYEITYSCNKVVCHEELIAISLPEAIEELERLIQADYVDVLGVTIEDLPKLLQGQNL